MLRPHLAQSLRFELYLIHTAESQARGIPIERVPRLKRSLFLRVLECISHHLLSTER